MAKKNEKIIISKTSDKIIPQTQTSEAKIFGVKGNLIDGVIIKRLNKIPDERGNIYHMITTKDAEYKGFGEIYFSLVYPNAIKGWHKHSKMTLNYAVVSGMIKLVLFDERPDSKTKGTLMEIFMGDENYLLVQIPTGVWNGFKGIGTKTAIVANCTNIAHDPLEIERLDPFNKRINYDWNIKME